MALLRKKADGDTPKRFSAYMPQPVLMKKDAESLWNEIMKIPFPSYIGQSGQYIYILPQNMPDSRGLGILRAGIQAFEIKGKRLEPCHHLFTSALPDSLRNRINFAWNAPETAAFLRGEELDISQSLKGWTGVSIENVMLGFGKASGGKLKNRYPKGLRNHV